MKAGKLATMIGLHPDTIRAWTDLYAEFFSPEARAEGHLRRDYTWPDQVLINTIHGLRKGGLSPEEIRARLAAGERNSNLPISDEVIEGETALAVYGKIQALEETVRRLEEQREHDQNTIARLNQEVGEWRAMYRMMKEQINKKDE